MPVLARVQLTLAAALLLAALALAGIYVLGDDGGVRAADPGEGLTVGPYGYIGAIAPPDVTPRDFTLPDQDGRPASLASARGKVALVTFMYSTCEDSCPRTAQTIRLALNDLGARARGLPVFVVSVDPGQDTARRTRTFLLEQSLYGRARYLRGTRAQLKPIWAAYGVREQGSPDEEFDDHTISVLIIGRDGRQRVSLPLDTITPEALVHDLGKVLREG